MMLCLCSRSSGRAGKPIVKWTEVFAFHSIIFFQYSTITIHFTVNVIIVGPAVRPCFFASKTLLCYFRFTVGSKVERKIQQKHPKMCLISQELLPQLRQLRVLKRLKVVLIYYLLL